MFNVNDVKLISNIFCFDYGYLEIGIYVVCIVQIIGLGV